MEPSVRDHPSFKITFWDLTCPIFRLLSETLPILFPGFFLRPCPISRLLSETLPVLFPGCFLRPYLSSFQAAFWDHSCGISRLKPFLLHFGGAHRRGVGCVASAFTWKMCPGRVWAADLRCLQFGCSVWHCFVVFQVYNAQEVCDNSLTLVKSTHCAVILGKKLTVSCIVRCGWVTNF